MNRVLRYLIISSNLICFEVVYSTRLAKKGATDIMIDGEL